MDYTTILTSISGRAGLVQINRPKQLNALNVTVMEELATALEAFDRDEQVGCSVITGNARAFAAGADIKEMAEASAVDMLRNDNISRWDRIRRLKKPVIAAVSGFCLGGGCEVAMACDLIVASESAQFGQPEINIGVMPGAGGTQRLTRAIGKSKAMEMVLTGRYLSAREAEQAGLVARVVPVEVYLDEALKLANEIASRPPLAVQLAKEAVNKAFETSLTDGLEFERRLFYFLFATADQKEGCKPSSKSARPNGRASDYSTHERRTGYGYFARRDHYGLAVAGAGAGQQSPGARIPGRTGRSRRRRTDGDRIADGGDRHDCHAGLHLSDNGLAAERPGSQRRGLRFERLSPDQRGRGLLHARLARSSRRWRDR